MLTVSGLAKTYKNHIIFEQFGFSAAFGRFTVFIGPSGCGKSTLFDVLSGSTRAESGSISWHNTPVADLGRIAAYMHQKDLLLPWCSLLDNALLPAKVRGSDLTAARQQAGDLFRTLGISGYEKYYPGQVSGGMRQRCALIRTLMFDRELILLDEPLSALDAITQRSLQMLLLRVQMEFHKTLVMITHDIEEALLLADDLYLLGSGPMIIREKFTLATPKPRKFSDPELLSIKEHVLGMLAGDACHETF